jgi:hypothetical protein
MTRYEQAGQELVRFPSCTLLAHLLYVFGSVREASLTCINRHDACCAIYIQGRPIVPYIWTAETRRGPESVCHLSSAVRAEVVSL